VFWLLGGLATTTIPIALAVGVPSFAVLVTVSGFLCAPTITATVEQLSRLVPERHRGEMMGWHGSAMTAGSALGAPIAGFAIDRAGWQWGFLSVSAIGVVVALAGALAPRGRARGRRGGAGTRAAVAPGVDSVPGVPAATLEH
jgi:MFS family permease